MRQYSGFSTTEESNKRYRYLLKEGVIGRAMPQGDIIGLSPPLCLSKSEVDIIISSLKKSVDKVHNEI